MRLFFPLESGLVNSVARDQKVESRAGGDRIACAHDRHCPLVRRSSPKPTPHSLSIVLMDFGV
jgi:hypothetical protein